MPGRVTSRAQDERDLDILRLRCAGYRNTQIASHLGMKPSAVSVVIQRVRKDDELHEGRDLSSEYQPAEAPAKVGA